jgi:hypothetical protein
MGTFYRLPLRASIPIPVGSLHERKIKHDDADSTLDEGQIPYRNAGVRRRVLLCDIVEYRRLIDCRREEALDELAGQAQELGMGY